LPARLSLRKDNMNDKRNFTFYATPPFATSTNSGRDWAMLQIDHHDLNAAREWFPSAELHRRYRVTIEPETQKRSLNANSYCHKLFDLLAEKLRSDRESVKDIMIERYGKADYIVMRPEAVETLKRSDAFRTVKEMGEVLVNGKTGMQLQCFWHTAQLNSQEFSVLLDGVCSECKEIGIPTLDDAEITALADAWKPKG